MLNTNTMASASIKKILGIASTDIGKGLGNEALRTGFSISGSTIFGADIPSDPANETLFSVSGGVVEFVRLKMIADPSSNGHAYIAQFPDNYQANTINTQKAKPHFADGARLVDSAGKVQIVPSAFGAKYEVIPYSGGTNVKGSGQVIAPADARDWFIDLYNGVFYQQGSGGTDIPVDYIECFIWIGEFISEKLSTVTNQTFISGASTLPTANGFYTVDECIGPNVDFSIAKWFVSTKYLNQAMVLEVSALKNLGAVKYNESSKIVMGAPLLQMDVDVSNGNIRLLAKPAFPGLVVEVKRLQVL